MADRELQILTTDGAYYDAPRWHDGLWWVAGRYRKGIYTVTPQGKQDQIGSLGVRRAWAPRQKATDSSSFQAVLASLDVLVDGCCLDAEGMIWAADVNNARVIRVREGGEIVEEIKAPEGQIIFACMLGGHD